MRVLITLLLVLGAAFAAPAQRSDFLTVDEADQIREAQDPNARLSLYLKFARQRLELLKQTLAKEQPGRSILAQEALSNYERIIDTIDTVLEDALRRNLDVTKGMKAVADAEEEFIKILTGIQESKPKDLSRYEFALAQALETTEDSFDMASEDIKDRASRVAADIEREEKELEALMQPKDRERKKAEEKAAAAEAQKRKPPTLLRKGETLKKQQ